jgi:hypothetical protein
LKICDDHWKKLRAAIELRGLSHLVIGSPEKAVNVLAAQASDSQGFKDTYDPLMAANFAIWNNALEAFGLNMMVDDAPCPLCLMDDHAAECTEPDCKKNSGLDWIEFAADGQLEVARQKGLVPQAS